LIENYPKDIKTVELAKSVGKETRKDVNRDIYALEKEGKVEKVNISPPTWRAVKEQMPKLIDIKEIDFKERRTSGNKKEKLLKSPVEESAPGNSIDECLNALSQIPNLLLPKRDEIYHENRSYSNPHQLSTDEILAIRYFTYGCGKTEMEKSTYLYFHLNKALQSKDPEQIKVWNPFVKFLESALAKVPDTKQIAYRGIPTKEELPNYTSNRDINWIGFTSMSSKKEKATKFSGNEGIVFEIEMLNGKDISEYSMYPKENEFLLPRNQSFVVKETLKTDDGFKIVKLLQRDTNAHVY